MPKSLKENGAPAQQWYWGDWFTAFDVRICSMAARGLWIDMLGIMWKAKPRGTLTINGNPVDMKMLALIVHAEEREVKEVLEELEEKKVFSRLKKGTIVCRRLYYRKVPEKTLSEMRAEAGRKGAKRRWQKVKQRASKGLAKSNKKVAINNVQIPQDNGGEKSIAKIANIAASSSTSSTNINKDKNIILKEIVKEREILNLLKNTKNFNFNSEKDKKFLKDLVVEFSDIDVFEVIKRICANWIDIPLFKTSRPRVQIRVWCKNERKWTEERRIALMAGKNLKKPTEEEKKFKLEYDKRRKDLEKKYLPEVRKARKEGDPKARGEIDNKIKIELALWSRDYWGEK